MLYIVVCNASWISSGSGQYHIQTDEGPERYFRYQTDNGQYRKEKRLKDGTVIGTDAWIDAAGLMRAKDYIADGQGYRILRSKTVYVGHNLPIDQAIRTFKNVPAQSDTLDRDRNSIFATTHKNPIIYPSTTPIPITPTSYVSSTSLQYPSTTPAGYHYSVTPRVYIHHHSQPLDEINGNSIAHSHDTNTLFAPIVPLDENRSRAEQLKPVAVVNTTPLPIDGYSASTIANSYSHSSSTARPIISSTASPVGGYSASTLPSSYSNPSTIRPLVSSTPYSGFSTATPSTILYSSTTPSSPISTYHPLNYRDHYNKIPISSTDPSLIESSTIRPIVPIDNNELKVQPLFSRRQASVNPLYIHSNNALEYNNNLGNGYDPQFPKYDGISVYRNGFRYYLPKQYHEEDNTDPERRAGSFGYVDPFGIRRVIYYNTSPEGGIQIKKNNRYTGHDATPYDPRPL